MNDKQQMILDIAKRGAAALPYIADEELWNNLRAQTDNVRDAMNLYDEIHIQRDISYAKKLIAAVEELENK